MNLKTGSLGLVLFALGAACGAFEWSARQPAFASAAPAAPLPSASVERTVLSTAEIGERALAFAGSIEGRADGKPVYGAAVVLDTRGHVLTSWHVVDGLEPLRVRFSDGASVSATLVEHDTALDLALLKLATPRSVAPPLGSVVGLRAGENVFAIGTPRRMSFSLARGLLSYVGRDFDGVRYLQTDLPMNGGSSGGPVLDERGELVGIASFILRDAQGLAFALPIDYALRRFARALELPAQQPAFERWLSSKDSSANDEARRKAD